jgi:hypothetical protein
MGKHRGNKSASAKRENEKTIREAYDEESDKFIFARIDSNLGAGGFRIVLNDSTLASGIPRGLFNRRTLRIKTGDIVLVEKCSNDSRSHQIVAILPEDEAKHFYSRKRISEAVWKKPDADGEKEKEDAFEFVDEDEEVVVDEI